MNIRSSTIVGWNTAKGWALTQVRPSLYTRSALYLQGTVILVCYTFARIWYPILPGYAVAALAVAAVIMTIRPATLSKGEQAAWIAIVFTLFISEMQVIADDRSEQDNQHHTEMAGQERQFTETLGSIAAENKNSVEQFKETMKQFVVTNQREQDRFNALVEQDKQLFAHEEKLAESTSGILTPASLPSPDNDCIKKHPDGFAVLYGDNTSVIKYFPHHIVVSSAGPLMTLDKLSSGDIVIIMDVRHPTGKIVARLDEQGYVIGSRLLIKRPDNSTLIVFDEYGNKALDVHYLNPRAVSVNGYLNYSGQIHNIQLENNHYACSYSPNPNPGAVDIFIK